MTPEDLRQICTVDGVVWWAVRTEEPTHAEKLFRGPVPQEGDLVIAVDEEDRLIAKRIRAIDTGISFWKPFIIDVGEKGGLVQRSMTNNKPYALQ